MNKKYIITGVVIVLLALAGAYMYRGRDQAEVQNDTTTTQNGQQTTTTADKDALESIKSAMSRGATMKCEYTADGITNTTFIKGSSVRSTLKNQTDAKAPNQVLLLGTKFYTWNDTTKQGITMTINPEAAPSNSADLDKDINTDVVGELERYRQNCKEMSVSNDTFTVPTNITFQDFSKLFQ